ncbi:MAG: hypothetical protein AAGL10_10315 [Pseudomonadota bacterium]
MIYWLFLPLLIFVALYFRERGRSNRLMDRIAMLENALDQNAHDISDDAITSEELAALRERVQVLERIATSENSAEARKAQRIAAEIESLRGDIARRSSTKTEDMSE